MAPSRDLSSSGEGKHRNEAQQSGQCIGCIDRIGDV